VACGKRLSDWYEFSGGLVGDDFYAEFAGARTVELGKEDLLPLAEGEPAVLDPDGLRAAEKGKFDVGIGVPFRVAEAFVVRDKAIEGVLHVAGDVGIVALVDDYAGGSVRDEEVAGAIGAAGRVYELFDFGRDVPKFGAARGADFDCVEHEKNRKRVSHR
jgi:hypothetical protein